MEVVELTTWLPYTPIQIYEYLTDPDALASVVGRINRAWIVERHGEVGQVGVELDMPLRRTLETVGEVEGVRGEKLSFISKEPFPLQFSWAFTAETQNDIEGSSILATLGFDLSSFGVPAGGRLVKGLVSNELKEDLDRLAQRLETHFNQ